MSAPARRGLDRAIPRETLLAFRLCSQRLDQRTDEPLGEIARAVGFFATPGGATPYLSLHARAPRHERCAIDHAVFDLHQLLDLPFAHGSTVLAPAADAPFVLGAAARAHQARVKSLAGEPLDEKKRARLAEAIASALGAGPLTADDLRARLPESLCVPWSERGRKAGIPSLFTFVLRELVVQGAILRVQKDHRLDRESFVYALPPEPLPPPPSRAEALSHLASLYFGAFGPAPAGAFAFWADASMTEARAAMADARLAPVEVEGEKEPHYLPAERVDLLLAFAPPLPGRVAFVPFRDPLIGHDRDLRSLLPAAHREVRLADWRGRLVPAGGGSAVHQHFLVQGGLITGVWEFDAQEKRVRFQTFDPLPTRVHHTLEEAAAELGDWIAHELGAARFYGDDRGDGFGRLDQVVESWGLTVSRDR